MRAKWNSGFLVLALAAGTLPASNAGAVLVAPRVFMDSQETFLGKVDFRGPLTPAVTIMFDNDPNTEGATSINWTVFVRQARVDIQQPNIANDIEVGARHIMPPHGEGRGPLVEVADFLNVVPGTTVRNAQGMVDIHIFSLLHGNHRDFVQARIDRLGAGISRISIRADHPNGGPPPPPVRMIPIPAAAPLLASALALVALLRRRRPTPSVDVATKAT